MEEGWRNKGFGSVGVQVGAALVSKCQYTMELGSTGNVKTGGEWEEGER